MTSLSVLLKAKQPAERRRLRFRKTPSKSAPARRPFTGRDGPAVLGHNPLRHGQAQTCSSGVQSGRDKGFEQIVQDMTWYTGSIIQDCTGDPLLVSSYERFRFNTDLAFIRHGEQGISQQVHKYLNQTIGIARNGIAFADIVVERDGGGFLVDCYQPPALVNNWPK